MINQPSVDKLVEKLSGEGPEVSRYALCVVAAKRARQLLDQNNAEMRYDEEHELATASLEIAEGKVKIIKD